MPTFCRPSARITCLVQNRQGLTLISLNPWMFSVQRTIVDSPFNPPKPPLRPLLAVLDNNTSFGLRLCLLTAWWIGGDCGENRISPPPRGEQCGTLLLFDGTKEKTSLNPLPLLLGVEELPCSHWTRLPQRSRRGFPGKTGRDAGFVGWPPYPRKWVMRSGPVQVPASCPSLLALSKPPPHSRRASGSHPGGGHSARSSVTTCG
jgi:hypothetical protein